MKLAYLFIFITWISLGFFAALKTGSIPKAANLLISCPNHSKDLSTCLGHSLLLRSSLILVLFHSLLLLLSLTRSLLSDYINRNLWSIKILLLLIASYYSFYVLRDHRDSHKEEGGKVEKVDKAKDLREHVFDGLFVKVFWCGVYVSPVFIVWAWLGVVDVGYKVNQYLASKYFEKESKLACGALFGLTGISISFLVFTLFDIGYPSKPSSLPLVSMILLSIFSIVLTLAKFNPQANILTTTFILALLSYFFRLAQLSQPENTAEKVDPKVLSFSYFFLAAIAAVFISVSSGSNCDYSPIEAQSTTRNQGPIQMTGDESTDDIESGDTTSRDNSQTSENTQSEVEKRSLFRKQTILFHIFLILMALTAPAVLTNWKYDENKGFQGLLDTKGHTAYWIQYSSTLTAGLLYIWTLVAPRIFPGRNFE